MCASLICARTDGSPFRACREAPAPLGEGESPRGPAEIPVAAHCLPFKTDPRATRGFLLSRAVAAALNKFPSGEGWGGEERGLLGARHAPRGKLVWRERKTKDRLERNAGVPL